MLKTTWKLPYRALSIILITWSKPFPKQEILEKAKLKGFPDDKLTLVRNLISLFDWVENIVGKGENAGYQHFLLFPQCFQKAFIPDP